MTYRPRNRIWKPTALTESIVGLVDLLDHLRVTDEYDTTLIQGYARAATSYVEKSTQRLLSVRTATLTLPDLPGLQEPIELPGGDVASITSMVVDGTPFTTIAAYGSAPAALIPTGTTQWPSTSQMGWPVTITYQVGYETAPFELVQAIKLLVGEMYNHRSNAEDVIQSRTMLPSEMLIAPYRITPL